MMNEETYIIVKEDWVNRGVFYDFQDYEIIYVGTDNKKANEEFNSFNFGIMSVWQNGLLVMRYKKHNGKVYED
ncbi:hypothetical protein [Priestia megaterium]|uniref:hypothetical protein n=1 Tax=Priestia megaterium TaxID=1404 RepID=UPI002877B198|nr:hypothetical protein [Priestia megaterium]